MDKIINEPIREYRKKFSREIKIKAEKYFKKLIEENDIDREKNRETVSKFHKTLKKYNRIKSAITLYKIFGWIFIFPILIMVLIMFFRKIVTICMILACMFLGVIVVLFFVFAKKLKNRKTIVWNKVEELNDLAKKQAKPLINAIDCYIPIKIFNEVIPNVKLDFKFHRRKHEYMSQREALPFFSDNECVAGVYAGSVGENPFIIIKRRKQKMKKVPYSGSLDIYWQTVEEIEDENGEKTEEVVIHNQTLRAMTWHEQPDYDTHVETIFSSPIAEELCFSREPFGVKKMSDKKVTRKIKSTYKKYKKKEIKNINIEKSLTLLENEDFEGLFGAFDRDNEMQYRELFTPLAQQNIVKLIRNREYEGDEFSFAKNGNLNLSINYSFQNIEFNLLDRKYCSMVDIDETEKSFKEFVSKFSKGIYMNLLPFLSIPAYQKAVPRYSYKKDSELFDSDTYPSSLETEAIFCQNYNIGNSDMPCICKATYVSKKQIEVEVYGFDASWETEYVSCLGGDGLYHDVPVRWLKYEKVSKKVTV